LKAHSSRKESQSVNVINEDNLSFKMISILSIWKDFYVNDKLESEVVRIVLEKVVEIRE